MAAWRPSLAAALLCMAAVSACERDAGREALLAEARAAAPFYAAIDASNAATRLTNRYMAERVPPDEAQLEAILLHLHDAILSADMLERDQLARMHPEMPDRFTGGFRAGLADIAAGIEARDPDLTAEGHWRLDRWADWIEANSEDIRFPPRVPVQEP